jgi:multimeric flavodoxin WrbA
MKFLVINASPNKEGATSKFVKEFLNAAEKIGEVEVLHLHDDPPRFSDGNLNRPETMNKYQRKVMDCDALFIATPTYWFNVPAILKAFIENLTTIEEDLWKRPRILGVAIYAPQGGEQGAGAAIILPFSHFGFALVDVGYVYHRGISEDDWAWEDLRLMPERMAGLWSGRSGPA